MKQTVKQTATEYGLAAANNFCNNILSLRAYEEDCLRSRFEDAFLDGARWQRKQSSWIEMELALPAIRQKVLFQKLNNTPFIGWIEEDNLIHYEDEFGVNQEMPEEIQESMFLHWMAIPQYEG